MVLVEIALADDVRTAGSAVYFGIDCESGSGSGSGRDDYGVFVAADGAVLVEWHGDMVREFPHAPIRPELADRRIAFTLTLADLGASRFSFWATAVRWPRGGAAMRR
jgi:hypothetical protein